MASSGHPFVHERTLTTWREVVDAVDFLAERGWVFRGHDHAEWTLETSLERHTGARGSHERESYWHFVRLAPRFLQAHLVPRDDADAAAWLGLIQHYGGPTRLLDVTKSPYIGLYFAFEAPGDQDRALWSIERTWCMAECARTMSEGERIPLNQAIGRVTGAQAQLVYSLVHGQRFRDPLFASFKPFSGVFPLDPWKPDSRQIAQQAVFLCVANVELGFMDNLAAYSFPDSPVLYKFILPSALRTEVIERLGLMNVTAATLFPDLTGLARSLRTLTIRRIQNADALPPWDVRK